MYEVYYYPIGPTVVTNTTFATLQMTQLQVAVTQFTRHYPHHSVTAVVAALHNNLNKSTAASYYLPCRH